MLKKFRELCNEKKWKTNCLSDFRCADGELVETCYASMNMNNYMLIKPLTKLRTGLEIPFQSTLNTPYVWRVFSSRTYIADSDWWDFSNDEWSIYCIKSPYVGDLALKFGFGSLISNDSIKSVILKFIKYIDNEGISSYLDPTQISASDIVLGVHDAKDYGGIKGIVDLLQKQLTSLFKSINIEIQFTDWIVHPGSGRFSITIPYEFQGTT